MDFWAKASVVGQVAAAIFAAASAWLAFKVLRNDRTPVVTVKEWTKAGAFDAELQEIRNSGKGAAFNTCLHTPIQNTLQDFVWLGDLGPDEVKRLESPIRIELTDADPHRIFYQDLNRSWYSTRLAKHGYGIGVVWEGHRWFFFVPAQIRRDAKGETTVEYYSRLVRSGKFKRGNAAIIAVLLAIALTLGYCN